jgi:hypothetical protein
MMENPPSLQVMLRQFEYIRVFIREWSYFILSQTDETSHIMKRRIFSTLRGMMPEVRQPPPMRTLLISSSLGWPGVWDNISQPFLQDDVSLTWCRLTHIIPTQIRLHNIHLQESDICGMCSKGYSYPSLEDMWKVCRDMVLEPGGGGWRWLLELIPDIFQTSAWFLRICLCGPRRNIIT